jgi:integrase
MLPGSVGGKVCPLTGPCCRGQCWRQLVRKAVRISELPLCGSQLRKFRIPRLKEKRISLGVYPDVGLKKARDRRDEMRTLVADGVDPSAARKQEKLMGARCRPEYVRGNRARAVREPLAELGSELLGEAARTPRGKCLSVAGAGPIRDIKAPELLSVLRRVESRGVLETAHRLMNYCWNIYRYAVATGRAERDISADLRGALPPSTPRHHASVTEPRDVAALLRAIDGYRGSNVTRYALQLAPLGFVRPGELRKAEWSEIDLEAGEWRIPAERMKMKAKHIVPLSMQAVAILRALQPLTGKGRYVFPGARSRERCMSENTVNGGLRRLGWSGSEMTGHGFRSMGSTLLNEQGWNGCHRAPTRAFGAKLDSRGLPIMRSICRSAAG